MTSNPILETLYSLKSHPFGEMYDAPLNPRADPAQVSYYFDLYDWKRSPLLQKLLDVFPDDKVLANSESVLILITGPDLTGRKSLHNLILHKIELKIAAPNNPLIVTELELQEGNRAENIKQIGIKFMFTYARNGPKMPALSELKQIFDMMTAGKPTGDKAYYSEMFQLWRDEIQPHYKQPLVLSLSGDYLYNTLQVIFNSTRHLFKFVIVRTGKPSDAETCRKLLADEKKHVSLIESNKLDRSRASEYVCWRLFAERFKSSPYGETSLVPFSVEALDALYKEGPTFKTGEQPIIWDFKFVTTTLRHALNTLVDELERKTTASGVASLKNLDPKERIIGAEQIRKARQAIHNTSGDNS